MRARYYSPEMKRFVNADIVAGSISNAVTLNRFAYANGNPVSFIDPFGLAPSRLFSQTMGMDDGGGGRTSTEAAIGSSRNDSSNIVEKQLERIFNSAITSAKLEYAYIETVQLISNTNKLFELEVGTKWTLLNTGDTQVYFEMIGSPSTVGANNFKSLYEIDDDTIHYTIHNTIKATPKFELELGLDSVSFSKKFQTNDNVEISTTYGIESAIGGYKYSMEYAVSHTDDNDNSIGYVIGVEHTLRNKRKQPQTVPEFEPVYEFANGYDWEKINKKLDILGTLFPNKNSRPVVITATVILASAAALAVPAKGGRFDRTCVLMP